MTSTSRRPTRRHWYRQYVGGCPVCGRNAGYRERVYGRRPKDRRKRYVYLPDQSTYDHCLERQ